MAVFQLGAKLFRTIYPRFHFKADSCFVYSDQRIIGVAVSFLLHCNNLFILPRMDSNQSAKVGCLSSCNQLSPASYLSYQALSFWQLFWAFDCDWNFDFNHEYSFVHSGSYWVVRESHSSYWRSYRNSFCRQLPACNQTNAFQMTKGKFDTIATV